MTTDQASAIDDNESHSDAASAGSTPPTRPTPQLPNIVLDGRRLTEQLLRTLGQRPVSDLSADVPREATEESLVSSAEDVDETDFGKRKREAEANNDAIKNQILEAERNRLNQQGGHRRVFFVWSMAAISAVLIFNGVVFWRYVNASNGLPSEAVLISWMSTSIVEVIGLGYIIARSLFQSNNDSPPVSKSDKKATKGRK